MGLLQIVMLVVEIIKLIMKIREQRGREAYLVDLNEKLAHAVETKDRAVLKDLRQRIRDRLKEEAQ